MNASHQAINAIFDKVNAFTGDDLLQFESVDRTRLIELKRPDWKDFDPYLYVTRAGFSISRQQQTPRGIELNIEHTSPGFSYMSGLYKGVGETFDDAIVNAFAEWLGANWYHGTDCEITYVPTQYQKQVLENAIANQSAAYPNSDSQPGFLLGLTLTVIVGVIALALSSCGQKPPTEPQQVATVTTNFSVLPPLLKKFAEAYPDEKAKELLCPGNGGLPADWDKGSNLQAVKYPGAAQYILTISLPRGDSPVPQGLNASERGGCVQASGVMG